MKILWIAFFTNSGNSRETVYIRDGEIKRFLFLQSDSIKIHVTITEELKKEKNNNKKKSDNNANMEQLTQDTSGLNAIPREQCKDNHRMHFIAHTCQGRMEIAYDRGSLLHNKMFNFSLLILRWQTNACSKYAPFRVVLFHLPTELLAPTSISRLNSVPFELPYQVRLLHPIRVVTTDRHRCRTINQTTDRDLLKHAQ
ncbi:hypothetical protein PUN28_015350 [Cardiocondyla obscurior]|uniref:Uncharacterized protein n=1 Tax=Cardiocondyla obscurior TaxID=286306 RepID=A0AAW2ETT7_9HYME